MMRRIIIAAAVIAGLGGTTRQALGQQGASTLPVIPGDARATAQLASIVEATRAQHLPVDPILAKVQYALIVHAPPARIVAAAQAVAGRLVVAREALAPRDIPSDVAAGESALSLGATREVLRGIREASHEPSVAVPLGVIAQLVAGGVKVERASQIVKELIRQGASGQQLASLQKNVNEDVGYGAKVDNALDLRMNGLRAILAPGTSAGLANGLQATDPRKGKP